MHEDIFSFLWNVVPGLMAFFVVVFGFLYFAWIFNKVVVKVETLDFRVGALEKRVEKLEERMDRLEARMERMEERMERMEAKFDKLLEILAERKTLNPPS